MRQRRFQARHLRDRDAEEGKQPGTGKEDNFMENCDFCKKSYKKLYTLGGRKYCFGCRCTTRHCKGCGHLLLHTETEGDIMWARYYCAECSTNGKVVHKDEIDRFAMKYYERDQDGEWNLCSGIATGKILPDNGCDW